MAINELKAQGQTTLVIAGAVGFDRLAPALPTSPAPHYLKHLAKWMLICIAALFAAALFVGITHA